MHPCVAIPRREASTTYLVQTLHISYFILTIYTYISRQREAPAGGGEEGGGGGGGGHRPGVQGLPRRHGAAAEPL